MAEGTDGSGIEDDCVVSKLTVCTLPAAAEPAAGAASTDVPVVELFALVAAGE